MNTSMDVGSPDYKRAFEAYIRAGTPIPLSVKEARTTSHYVWRARQDDKTRPTHAANHGKIFAWDNPPPTGHPGEDYVCRCIAEPYQSGFAESFTFTMVNVSDRGSSGGSPWSSFDFVDHYFNGGGQTVRLRNIGHLSAIVAEYNRIVIDDVL